MNIAAILSGGVGSRAAAGEPKQFIALAGKPMLLRTIEVFEASPSINRIIVVSHPDHLERIAQWQRTGDYPKWDTTVPGGSERYLSSWAAVQACGNAEGNLLIHDAARPLVSEKLIQELVEALETEEACAPAIALQDTLVEVDGNAVKRALNRQNFRLMQTPQAFRLSTIRTAFTIALQDASISFTDDCSIISRYLPHIKIRIIEGEISNKKLTYHSDIELFNKLFTEKDKKLLHK